MSDNLMRAQFNGGMALVERIDILQRTINEASFNPLAYNPQYGKLNYDVMITACNNLYFECLAKASKDEVIALDKIKNLINTFVRLNPLVKNVNGEMKISNKNLDGFTKLFDIYHAQIKKVLDAHDFNSPNKDDDDDGL